MSALTADQRYMKEAIERSIEGAGRTGTNPLVGACLVQDDDIIATGAHRRLGDDHAEQALFGDLPDHVNRGTLYVTLEPCIHHGRTPPCLPLLVDRDVDRVVLASPDPGPSVRGKGIKALRALGFPVETGVLETEHRWLNRSYFHAQQTGRPYIDLKLALSADGYLATPNHRSQWITGEASRDRGHRLRSRVDAVMVGAGTLRDDDPRLTDRVTDRDDQPEAIVVARSDRRLKLHFNLFRERAEDTILVVPPSFSRSLTEELRTAGVTILTADLYDGWFDWRQILPRLRRRDLGRILVEGGSMLAGSLLEQSVVNEMHLFYSGRLFGNGVPAFQFRSDPRSVDETDTGRLLNVERSGDDVYVRRLVETGFGEGGPTADQFDSLEIEAVRNH